MAAFGLSVPNAKGASSISLAVASALCTRMLLQGLIQAVRVGATSPCRERTPNQEPPIDRTDETFQSAAALAICAALLFACSQSGNGDPVITEIVDETDETDDAASNPLGYSFGIAVHDSGNVYVTGPESESGPAGQSQRVPDRVRAPR